MDELKPIILGVIYKNIGENLKECLKNYGYDDELIDLVEKLVGISEECILSNEESKNNDNYALKSVFCSIKLGDKETKPKYYPIKELVVNPKTIEEIPIPKDKVKVTKEDYEKFISKFKNELKNADTVNKILTIAERYLTFLPKYDDISLYDHIKMSSAIATVLFRYYGGNIKNKDIDSNEHVFLLIGGDLSGIQDFIYTISMSGALKSLRARSSFLELMITDICLEIVDRLGLSRANIIYNGGGSFTILAQNTEDAKKILEKIRLELTQYLYEKFNGKLYLAMDWIEISGKELKEFKKGKKPLITMLKNRINERKSKRFGEIIEKDIFKFYDTTSKRDECEICKKLLTESEMKYIKEKDIYACEFCKMLFYFGTSLPKIDGFIRTKEDISLYLNQKAHLEMPFSHIYAVNVEDLKEELKHTNKKVFEGSLLLLKNSFDFSNIPEPFDVIPYIVADYAKKSEKKSKNEEEYNNDNNKEQIADFDELAENSKGAKRIGVLRADVDNLGLIFGFGLKNPSLPRIATLSRFLDYFFKGYLNTIIKHDIKEVPKIPKDNKEPNIVVVYAGGDDLFIVGAWDEVFNLAFKINEMFRKYVGENSNITISAGLGYFDEKFPISRMANTTYDRLDTAKDEGKNRIYVIERLKPKKDGFKKSHKLSYEWNEFKKLWDKYVEDEKIKLYKRLTEKSENKLSKGVIWKILTAHNMYVNNPNGIKWNYYLTYHLARHEVDEMFKDLIAIDVPKAVNKEPQEIYYIDGILKIVLFSLREGVK
ncbi:CRISPR-associated protein, Csm1 family [Methanocaldococcus vulcanius M7]|uniref:CRISPR system single-strand-specific deoxyribonuclease Cas10/Csm1 (subtype III-A) n=1 Tax=Methanocaldococcus vulcanius (strain ATCC 700851 / DSM 12094 / M7) TaxID=579137 RepID=C9RHM6_METVM|nr:type III-A CRISPR-associated protein Cas10/Csm1 [Methanocaldococcus vulcanius]ACX73078.1 CRISPR-associated protein, Csm1 family [Methanocaldococcus vulcanius M7]